MSEQKWGLAEKWQGLCGRGVQPKTASCLNV